MTDFDFYEQYKDYATTDLLLIVQRPDGYQPEAVEAARRRLAERAVSSEEEAAVKTHYEVRDRAAREKVERIDHLKGQVADLLEPVLQPSTGVNPEKWLNLFLIVLGLQYAWTLIQTFIALFKSFSVLNVITVVYLPFFFYLLYKRKRWGWILVYAGILIGLIGVPMQLYAYSVFLRAYGQGAMSAGDAASIILPALLRIAFAVFLWRPDVCDLFGVDRSTRNKTVLYTSVLALLFVVGLSLLH